MPHEKTKFAHTDLCSDVWIKKIYSFNQRFGPRWKHKMGFSFDFNDKNTKKVVRAYVPPPPSFVVRDNHETINYWMTEWNRILIMLWNAVYFRIDIFNKESEHFDIVKFQELLYTSTLFNIYILYYIDYIIIISF